MKEERRLIVEMTGPENISVAVIVDFRGASRSDTLVCRPSEILTYLRICPAGH